MNTLHNLTARNVTRFWYGIYNNKQEYDYGTTRNLAAHTIIQDPLSNAFSSVSPFVPMQKVLDLVLVSEINTADEVAGVMLHAFRSSYDPLTNQILIGGSNNLQYSRDLMLRPLHDKDIKGPYGKHFNTDKETAMLLSALYMDLERQACAVEPSLMRYPHFAEVLLSFTQANAPEFAETPGLKCLAWELMQLGAPTLKELCVPDGYPGGKVRRIVRDQQNQATLVEIDNLDYCYDLPSWAAVLVEKGQALKQGDVIATVAYPEILGAIEEANSTIEEMWDGFTAYVGKAEAKKMLHLVWNSAIFKWPVLNLVMCPHYILEPQQIMHKLSGAWRDLRKSLGRVNHGKTNPKCEVIRANKREGCISVWPMTMGTDSLKFDLLGGVADLSGTNPVSVMEAQ